MLQYATLGTPNVIEIATSGNTLVVIGFRQILFIIIYNFVVFFN